MTIFLEQELDHLIYFLNMNNNPPHRIIINTFTIESKNLKSFDFFELIHFNKVYFILISERI